MRCKRNERTIRRFLKQEYGEEVSVEEKRRLLWIFNRLFEHVSSRQRRIKFLHAVFSILEGKENCSLLYRSKLYSKSNVEIGKTEWLYYELNAQHFD